ncbi:MAG: TlpA family protein disulfide reductase, partial [Pirellulales bacterium]|nr:TlpA family protein disulfide reductase [Pirellulales bacterium]
DIDQLLIGDGIKAAASVLPYNQWELQPAVEPLMAQGISGGEGASAVGSESPLVGQAAPEIKLDMLDGERFVLSQYKGQVVVLDFWATWCAPCMQTMPLVEEAMAEFDPEQVRLVSVNLEESADHIRAVMERHKLSMPVALDIDGVAAGRYQARAIPQMVIVDQTGKIARLYVGGGQATVDQMKAAITELLSSES